MGTRLAAAGAQVPKSASRTVAVLVRALVYLSAMREELHHLVDQLPEQELRPALELIRGRVGDTRGNRDLPFFASFEADPDLAERAEDPPG
jgi:hypothetical protein